MTMVLQHISSLPCTALAASKEPVVWHSISSFSRFSYTASAMLHNVKVKSSCQPLTSSAAQRQGAGSNAISGSMLPPSQTHTSVQVALPRNKAKTWPDMSGEALLLLHSGRALAWSVKCVCSRLADSRAKAQSSSPRLSYCRFVTCIVTDFFSDIKMLHIAQCKHKADIVYFLWQEACVVV